MRAAGVMVAVAAALLLQATLAGMAHGAATLVNLVLVTVVYVALAYGPVTGLLAGAAGGLVQDAIAGGIIGIGGLSKTIVGFFVGVLGAQFIVSQPLPRFVMFVGASFVHELCFNALQAVVETRGFTMPYSRALVQALVNGVIGILAFQVVEGAPGLVARRRANYGRRRY